MFKRCVAAALLLVAVVFVVYAVAADKPAGEKQPAKSCCEAKLACCTKEAACCSAAKKLGCCEEGRKCCAENRACCHAPQKCCVEGEACCDEGQACCGPKAGGQKAAAVNSCCEV